LHLKTKTVVVKPRADGCSAGVVHLSTLTDLQAYCAALKTGVTFIPKGTFTHQIDEIEMPRELPKNLLFEAFVETDRVRIKGNRLTYRKISGWVEMTVGVVEHGGILHVMNPSITIAEGEVLSLEEKFQGGTGINITPPPESLMSAEPLEFIKAYVKNVAAAIGLTGYCRIDLFVELATGRIKVIEVNALPGLTPSTVLYHQALAETPPLYPRGFLESLLNELV
jgi:D-alanine-D-alanine ligase-like ATP-grasp enzyme